MAYSVSSRMLNPTIPYLDLLLCYLDLLLCYRVLLGRSDMIAANFDIGLMPKVHSWRRIRRFLVLVPRALFVSRKFGNGAASYSVILLLVLSCHSQ